MNFSLEAVEKVMEAAGVEYHAAKEALIQAEGDVDKAIRILKPEDPNICEEIYEDVNETIDELKKKVEEGNTNKIQVLKNDDVILSVPVTAGIIGGVVGFVAAPWAMVIGAATAFGLGCRMEIVKSDEPPKTEV